MHSLRISRLGIITALLFSLQNVSATTSGSEVVLFTPWTFVRQKMVDSIANRTISDQQKFDKVDWQLNPWTPHLTGVQWDLKTQLDLVSLNSSGVTIKSKRLLSTISVKQLNLDQIVEREVSGVVLRVHVVAQCEAFTMSQSSAQMDLNLEYQFQPQRVVTRVNSFNLQWPANSWKVSAINCQGPAGFDKTVKDELTHALMSADLVKPWLQGLLANKAQSEADTLLTQISSPIPVNSDKSNLSMVLRFDHLKNSNDGILNYGSLVWDRKGDQANLSHLTMNGIPPAVAKSSRPVFVSSTDGWSNLIHAQLQARPAKFKLNLNRVKPFSDLLASPNQQSVVWPDLLFYTVNSPFTMLVDNPRTYDLQWLSDGTATLNTGVTGVIQSERDGRQWNYVDVTGNVIGKMKIQINDSKLSAGIAVSDSAFTAKFEPKYVQAFNANTKLDERVLQGLGAYVNQGFKYSSTLPTINLGFAGHAKFIGWSGISKDLILMPMSLILSAPGAEDQGSAGQVPAPGSRARHPAARLNLKPKNAGDH